MNLTAALLAALIFAAVLYSSVGNAGASGYLAIMALCGVPASVMKPTALCLNVLVAAIATTKFYRADCFSWGTFWPFAVTSIPLAFVGGAIDLPARIFRPVVGIVLLYAAVQTLRRTTEAPPESKQVKLSWALACGAAIGLISGLTATGGGIFLTPLLLSLGWAGERRAAGVSAALNLANSVAGATGQFSGLETLPGALPYWALAARFGGWIGAEYGSRQLGSVALRRLLAIVLVSAGLKMVIA